MSARRIIGKYEIIEEIGRGGMATVYKALDTDLQRTVALKVLPEYFRHDPSLIRRFKQEAIHAAKLEHPNIITIHDVGEDKGLLYFVMQYVEGQTLRQLIQERGPLDLAEATGIIKQMASALDYAHGQGYVHRDVKPTNILIGQRGQAILTDFGIVKAADGTSLTKTGTMVGTPEYMSPEQVKGIGLDPRTDVYSLGVVCYEMLAGQAPFRGETPSVLHAHVYERPIPLQEVNPRLSPAVEGVVERAMAKQPQLRYGTAGEMARSLEGALAGRVVDEHPTLIDTRLPTTFPPIERRFSLSPPILIGVAVIAVALIGASLLISRPGSMPAARATSTPSLTPTTTLTRRAPTPTSTPLPPTATPTSTPRPPTATSRLPTATPRPPTPTPRPPMPTATRIPMPAASPTPKFYVAPSPACPPGDLQTLHRRGIELDWTWSGRLAADEYFEVRVWPSKLPGCSVQHTTAPHTGVGWTKETEFTYAPPDWYHDPRYCWAVAVIRGTADGRFLAQLSPESPPCMLVGPD